MDGLTKEIEEVTKNALTKAQKENLEKAHRLFHGRLTGPLPFAVQIAIVVLTQEESKVKSLKPTVSSQAKPINNKKSA